VHSHGLTTPAGRSCGSPDGGPQPTEQGNPLGFGNLAAQQAGLADLQVGERALAGAADVLAHGGAHGHVEQHVHRVVNWVHDEWDGCARTHSVAAGYGTCGESLSRAANMPCRWFA